MPNLIARLTPVGPAATDAESVALLVILPVAVLAGFAEELGWRGYMQEHLMPRLGVIVAALLVGLAWTVWHLPFYFIAGTVQEEAGLWSQDFWFDMANRIPLAVLFAWVYVNTAHSILGVVLLHAADNIGSVVISPEGDQLIVRLAVVTALAFIAVLALQKNRHARPWP